MDCQSKRFNSPAFQESSTTLEYEGQQIKHSCKQHVKIWTEEKNLHSPISFLCSAKWPRKEENTYIGFPLNN
jgi:hypothetical protein